MNPERLQWIMVIGNAMPDSQAGDELELVRQTTESQYASFTDWLLALMHDVYPTWPVDDIKKAYISVCNYEQYDPNSDWPPESVKNHIIKLMAMYRSL